MFSALLAAGILQFDNNNKNEGLIVESLAPQGEGLAMRQANGTKPLRRGPSAALKAFSAALRPFVTLESDLGGNKLAFFAGSPMQRGLPSGLKGKDYINEAVFEVADPIQSSDSAVFSSDGASYFEWLRRYAWRNLLSQDISSNQKPLAMFHMPQM